MKKCPLCGEYVLSYNPHFRADACLITGCTMVMTGKNTYSHLLAPVETPVLIAVTVDIKAICVKCGRKGAITEIEHDDEVLEGKAICLDCFKEMIK